MREAGSKYSARLYNNYSIGHKSNRIVCLSYAWMVFARKANGEYKKQKT